jgi:superfamily II DNA/RNA helicase
MKFADLGLSDELLKSVTDAGYDEPTPIQAQAIPSVLMMRDLIGIAQTGTGKTAGFVLPMIDILAHGRRRALMPRADPGADARTGRAGGREFREVRQEPRSQDGAADRRRADGRSDQGPVRRRGRADRHPGRLMDLFERGKILLTGCNLLVIDEADRMLDMGFIPDIENICTKLPAQRQTLLFSATMPPPIKKLADASCRTPSTSRSRGLLRTTPASPSTR